MNKTRQSGFAAVEAVLVIIILGIVGFTGYFVWHSKQATDASLKNAQQSAKSMATKQKSTTPKVTKPVDPMSGWKAFSADIPFHYSYKYAPTWTVSSDGSTLSSGSGFTMSIQFINTQHPSLDYKPNVLLTHPVGFDSGKGFLDFIGGTPSQQADELVYSASLSQSETDSLNTFQHDGYNVLITAKTKNPESVGTASQDVDYSNAVLVVDSFIFE